MFSLSFLSDSQPYNPEVLSVVTNLFSHVAELLTDFAVVLAVWDERERRRGNWLLCTVVKEGHVDGLIGEMTENKYYGHVILLLHVDWNLLHISSCLFFWSRT